MYIFVYLRGWIAQVVGRWLCNHKGPALGGSCDHLDTGPTLTLMSICVHTYRFIYIHFSIPEPIYVSISIYKH